MGEMHPVRVAQLALSLFSDFFYNIHVSHHLQLGRITTQYRYPPQSSTTFPMTDLSICLCVLCRCCGVWWTSRRWRS